MVYLNHAGLGGNRCGQRAHAVIAGGIGHLRFQQLGGRVGVGGRRIGHAREVVYQRVGNLHFDHAALELLALGGLEGTHLVLHVHHTHILLGGGGFEAVALTDHGQGLLGALVGLHHTAAAQLIAHQGHRTLNRRHAVGLDTRHDFLPLLTVMPGAGAQIGDVVGLRRLRNNEMRAVQGLGIVAQHTGVNQARIHTA